MSPRETWVPEHWRKGSFFPWRGGPLSTPGPKVSLAAARKKLLARVSKATAAARKAPAAWKPRFKKLKARLQAAPAEDPASEEEAALPWVLIFQLERPEAILRAVVDRWVAARGVAWTTAALGAAERLWVEEGEALSRAQQYARSSLRLLIALLRLRAHLAAVPEAEHRAAQDRAEELREGFAPARRSWTSLLFPARRDWWEEDERATRYEHRDLDKDVKRPLRRRLVFSVQDAAQAALVRDVLSTTTSLSATLTLAAALGEDAEALLPDLAYYDKKNVAEAERYLPTDAAFATLARQSTAEVKGAAALRAAAERSPRRAIRVLGEMCADRGRQRGVYAEHWPLFEDVLRAVLASHPAARATVEPALSEAARAELERLHAGSAAPVEKPDVDPPRLPGARQAASPRKTPGDGAPLFPPPQVALPGFCAPGALPAPAQRDGDALGAPAVESLLSMLASSTPEAPHAGLAPVREACTGESLGDFSWALYEAWSRAGAPASGQWALHQLGWLGDERCLRKLGTVLPQWPGRDRFHHAVAGLAVLEAHGSDTALMLLETIAQRARSLPLRKRARQTLRRLAAARGLEEEELRDRVIPDFGLGPEGTLTLDYGPRTLTASFDEQLRPYVCDAAGRRLARLPRPGKKDDPVRAPAAAARYKQLKKDVRSCAALQLRRFEQAMSEGRRWSLAGFTPLVRHPLTIHLVRRLIWGTYSAAGKLARAFRVTVDRDFATLDDDELRLEPDARIRLVHRLELEDADAVRWLQRLADHELLQPFAQLERMFFVPTEDEREAHELTRVAGLVVPTGRLLGLERRGWRRGPALEGGIIRWLSRPLARGRVAKLALAPGIFAGSALEEASQTLGGVCLDTGHDDGRREARHPFGALSPRAFSELVRDLESLRGG